MERKDLKCSWLSSKWEKFEGSGVDSQYLRVPKKNKWSDQTCLRKGLLPSMSKEEMMSAERLVNLIE